MTEKNYHHVAVYGSLLRGGWSHGLLQDSECLGEGKTPPDFSMYSLGGFPGIIPDEDGTEISVEIYRVDDDTFRRLDNLEGYPSFYGRKECVITAHKHDSVGWVRVPCWIYFLPEDKKDEYNHLPLVTSGSWREWNDPQTKTD